MAGRFASARATQCSRPAGRQGSRIVARASGLFATGVGNTWLLATGIADVLFAALFAVILLRGDPAMTSLLTRASLQRSSEAVSLSRTTAFPPLSRRECEDIHTAHATRRAVADPGVDPPDYTRSPEVMSSSVSKWAWGNGGKILPRRADRGAPGNPGPVRCGRVFSNTSPPSSSS